MPVLALVLVWVPALAPVWVLAPVLVPVLVLVPALAPVKHSQTAMKLSLLWQLEVIIFSSI